VARAAVFLAFGVALVAVSIATTRAAPPVAAPSGSAKAEPRKPSGKKTDENAAAKKADPPLAGETVDYPYDGGGKARLAWEGRAFVHDKAKERARKGEALPLVVFIHGLNKALIPHRWMGGGTEGDVRRIASSLIEDGTLPPLVVAGPGSISKEAVGGASSFAELDTDVFLERTEAALAGKVKIDPARVVVVGHSGAGCSPKGGIVAPLHGKRTVLGVASIDTCMGGDLAKELAAAPPRTHVVVTWQDASWSKRPFELFSATSRRRSPRAPPRRAPSASSTTSTRRRARTTRRSGRRSRNGCRRCSCRRLLDGGRPPSDPRVS
jgi:hypothetical protein